MMIDEEELKALSGHGTIHKMGLCTCPCYDTLINLGRKIQAEREFREALIAVELEGEENV